MISDLEFARQGARQRDGGCVGERLVPEVDCWGRPEGHHVWRRGQGGPDLVDNLATLCTACHTWVHMNTGEAYERGLLAWSWEGRDGYEAAAFRRRRWRR